MTRAGIFTGTPEVPGAADGTFLTLGTVFKVTASKTITEVWWYTPDAGENPAVLPIKAQLWSEFTGSILGSGTFPTLTLGEWNVCTLDTPVDLIDDGRNYIASVVLERYTATPHYFDADGSIGDFTWVSGAGKLNVLGTSTDPAMPVSAFANGGYFIEPGFADAGGGPAVSVWNGTSELDATITVWDGASELPATVDTIA